jgi:hypothetical protein
LRYASALDDRRAIPAWVDAVLRKAVHPDPLARYDEPSEFAFALREPGPELLGTRPKPLIERNPTLFWQLLSLMLALLVAFLSYRLLGR